MSDVRPGDGGETARDWNSGRNSDRNQPVHVQHYVDT